MKIEILEPDQYHQLAGLNGPLDTMGIPSPAVSKVIVARAPDGAIRAYWVVQAAVHIEPIWLDPDLRAGLGGAKVFMAMVPAVMAAVASTGDSTFYTFAADETMVQYALRLGLTPLPYTIFEGHLPSLPTNEVTP